MTDAIRIKVMSPLADPLSGKQDADADLSAIAALSPSDNDIIQRKSGAWVNRTPVQLKSDLALVKGDVGLGNVDNTSDADKPVSDATQLALDGKQAAAGDLNDIAGLTPSDNDFLQRKAGAWVNRTIEQVKVDLGVGDASATLPAIVQTQQRPGDVPDRFSATLTGAAEDAADAPGDAAVTDDQGSVLRVGPGLILATRERVALVPGRKYRARTRFERQTDPSDPLGDAVRFGIQWLNKNKAQVSQRVIADVTPLIADGAQTYSAIVSDSAGEIVDYTWPATARYMVPFIQTYGEDGITDIDILEWEDITDNPAPDVLAAIEAAAQEAEQQAGVATAQASTATTQAGAATTQAAIATAAAGTSSAAALTASQQAQIATLAALAASATYIEATYADLPAASGVANGAYAIVVFDETRNDTRSLYQEDADAWEFVGSLSETAAVYESTLAAWFKGGVTGKRIAMVGDSVTDQFFSGVNPPAMAVPHIQPGGQLPGVTFANFGHAGVATSLFLSSPAYIDEMVTGYASTPFHLIVFGYGINGTREGEYATAAAFAADLIRSVNLMRANLPGVPILMRMPNPLLSTDVGGAGFVVPNSSAQAYSDILRDGYLLLQGLWPDVVVYNSREEVFNDTILAASAFMTDQLHPTGRGQGAMFNDWLQRYVGKDALTAPRQTFGTGSFPHGLPKRFNRADRASALTGSGRRLAPTVYPLTVLDGDYDLITVGTSAATTAGQANFSINGYSAENDSPSYTQDQNNARPDDVLLQLGSAGASACLIPASGASASNNSNITASYTGMGASSPNALAASTTTHFIYHYRHKYANSDLAKTYALRKKAYPVSAVFRVTTAANGSLVLTQAIGGPHPSQWQHRQTDIIVIGETAYPLIGSQFTASIAGNLLTVSAVSGSFGAIVAGQTIIASNAAATSGIMEGTTIPAFGTGGTTGTGGTGTYQLNNTHAAAVSSTTMQAVATMTMTATGNRQINLPGTDWSGVTALHAMVFGTGESRVASNLPETLRIQERGNIVTAGTGITLRMMPTRYGLYNVNRFRLNSPDAANTTTVTIRTTLNGFLTTVAVLTFPANGTIPQVVYNTVAGGIPVCDGVELIAVCTGAGTSGGLDMKFDTRA